MCWECYSCVKACPQPAIDVRGYADFAPLGHSVRVRGKREGTISCKIKFRDGREKNFVSPITTSGLGAGTRKPAQGSWNPARKMRDGELLYSEPKRHPTSPWKRAFCARSSP